jgi:hypothetical protein
MNEFRKLQFKLGTKIKEQGAVCQGQCDRGAYTRCKRPTWFHEASCVVPHSPCIVLITLGGKDLENGVPKETAFRNLKRIIESIQANDIGYTIMAEEFRKAIKPYLLVCGLWRA